jgi:hypothetical protein
VQDNHGVNLPPALPPGEYRLAVGMYDPGSGARLPVTVGEEAVGDSLLLGVVSVGE